MATLVNLQQAARLRVPSNAAGCAPSGTRSALQASRACIPTVLDEDKCGLSVNRRQMLLAGPGLVLTAAAGGAADGIPAPEDARAGNIRSEWEEVAVPVGPEVDLLDVGFVPRDWDHGFLVGTHKTLLETRDGGRSWSSCKVPDGLEDQVTFTCIRFEGGNGWIIGEPAVLLYTEDGGSNWKNIPLSLNGSESPLSIEAFGERQAELVTTDGAVLFTADGGLTLKPNTSQSTQASTEGRSSSSTNEIGRLSKIDRSRYGEYVAVSADGNAYLTWTQDQPWWRAHKDTNLVNIKNMGWLTDGNLWLLSQEGGLYFSNNPKGLNEFQESKVSIQGLGVNNISFRSPYEVWAAGSGGVLLRTLDGGETWIRDSVRKDFSNNLARTRFVDIHKGFMMGEGGVLFRHMVYRRSLQYIDVQSLRTIIKASEDQKQSGPKQNL